MLIALLGQMVKMMQDETKKLLWTDIQMMVAMIFAFMIGFLVGFNHMLGKHTPVPEPTYLKG